MVRALRGRGGLKLSLRVTPSESVILRKISSWASDIIWGVLKFVQSTASLQLGVVRPPCREKPYRTNIQEDMLKQLITQLTTVRFCHGISDQSINAGGKVQRKKWRPDSSSTGWCPRAKGFQGQASYQVQQDQLSLPCAFASPPQQPRSP